MGEAAATDERQRRAAFEQYVTPEIDLLDQVARSITRDPTDAQDLVQDTMLRAYRSIGRFDGRHPRAWLLTIMRNAQVNRLRRRRPSLLRDPDTTLAAMIDHDVGGSGPEAILLDGELDFALEQACAQLAVRFRDVIELVDIQGLSYKEAADLLGVPLGTVMSRLHRARSRIRQHLETSRRAGSVR